ncbi:MAG TPA: acetylxylan esterase [Bryobacteraceae bacterium]|nr:acetylxylan esterase [Bryobacteraceae bacterium]
MKTLLPLFLFTSLLSAQEGEFLKRMDAVAQKQLAKRSEVIQAITTRDQAERRKQTVRAKVLELLGGLPTYNGPLNPRVTGRLDRGQYLIEKVIFDSLPGLHVTANLYRPSAAGKYPGILLPLGHYENGKPAVPVQTIAANLVLKGFIVLVYDPLGQGERLQAYDAATGKSRAGGSTEQHIIAGGQSILVGQTFARYRIWDAKRALDYLVSRPEVDTGKIGCTGCSGGGTIATYISALDPRIKVAAPTCYLNSYRTLFAGSVGDSEQSLPNFISSGLDETDYVEMFAPKPWLMGSTKEDFFTVKGAGQVYEEAKRWYGIYGAADRLKWVVGPGPHGTPVEIREAIYEWMIRWLKDGKGDAKEQPSTPLPDKELFASESGQAGGRQIHEVIREAPFQQGSQAELKAKVSQWMRAGELEMPLQVQVLPAKAQGRRPAVILVETAPPQDATKLAMDNEVVAVLVPTGLPARTRPGRAFSGDWLANTRALMIGYNLTGIRARDIVRTVDLLSARPDVDPRQIRVAAKGMAGVWAQLARFSDARITGATAEGTPRSLRELLDAPAVRDVHDAALPGFLLHWDLKDLNRSFSGQ